jgi:hypothetical protein
MDASMLGVGVGFDTKGAGTVVIQDPLPSSSRGKRRSIWTVEDSREGWVKSLRIILHSFMGFGKENFINNTIYENAQRLQLFHDHSSQSLSYSLPEFDYSCIRPAGLPIKGFGGVSQGPEALRALHEAVISRLQSEIGRPISITCIVDVMNLIGK